MTEIARLAELSDLHQLRREFGTLVDERAAADILGTKVRTLQAWRQAGVGPPYLKLGPAANAPVRYPVAHLRDFLKSHLVRPAPLEEYAERARVRRSQPPQSRLER